MPFGNMQFEYEITRDKIIGDATDLDEYVSAIEEHLNMVKALQTSGVVMFEEAGIRFLTGDPEIASKYGFDDDPFEEDYGDMDSDGGDD